MSRQGRKSYISLMPSGSDRPVVHPPNDPGIHPPTEQYIEAISNLMDEGAR